MLMYVPVHTLQNKVQIDVFIVRLRKPILYLFITSFLFHVVFVSAFLPHPTPPPLPQGWLLVSAFPTPALPAYHRAGYL